MIIIEAGAPQDARGLVLYRFTRRCGRTGEWKQWLSAAEADGYRHRRGVHQEARPCA